MMPSVVGVDDMLFKKRKTSKSSVHFGRFPSFHRKTNAVGPITSRHLSASQMELERKLVETEKQYGMSMTRQLAFRRVQSSGVDKEILLTQLSGETICWNLVCLCITFLTVLIIYLHKENDKWMDQQLYLVYFGNKSVSNALGNGNVVHRKNEI